MNFLDNEVLLRTAISNIAGIRDTKVKFKGFDMGSYRRSLGAHLRKLLGDGVRVSLNNNNVRISFPRQKIFSDTMFDNRTHDLNNMLFEPYIRGEAKKNVHCFYAYNASEHLKSIVNLRNYMVGQEYLLDIAYSLDRLMFSNTHYQAVYEEFDTTFWAESLIPYHNFVRGIAFDIPTEPVMMHTTTPHIHASVYWLYHHRENVVLFNLGATHLDPNLTYPSFTLDVPYRALLDREFLTIIAGIGSIGNGSSNE